MKLTRRGFLRGACGTVLALPFLEALAPGVAGATPAGPGCPKRLLVVVQGNGCRLAPWIPSGTERAFSLGQATAPLIPFQDRIVVLAGLDNPLTPLQPGIDAHLNAELTLLTGKPAVDRGGDPPAAGGPSIDQVIADRIGGSTPFRRLDLGIGTRAANHIYSSPFLFGGTDQLVSVLSDPLETYNQIFGSLGGGPDPVNVRRGRVLDAVRQQFSAFRAEVDVADRIRLDAHAEKVGALETMLQRLGSAGSCDTSGVDLPYGHDPQFDDNLSAPAMIEMMVHAMSCGLTNVGTLQYTDYLTPTFPWLRTPSGQVLVPSGYDDWHMVVHDASGAVDDQLLTSSIWYHQQLAYLLQQLANATDIDGDNLLDTTLVVHISEFGNGDGHNTFKVPVILAGAVGPAGGGRFLSQYMSGGVDANWQSSSYSTNQLYTSLLHLFDQPDTTFGTLGAQIPNGPLPGLL